MNTLPLNDYTHIAWIPTLSGQLFLDQVACQLSTPSSRTELNCLIEINSKVIRLLTSASRVNWQDLKIDGHSGRFGVVFACITERASTSLEGTLCLFPLVKSTNENWENTRDNLRRLKELADSSFDSVSFDDTQFLDRFKLFSEGIDAIKETRTSIKVGFRLDRSGIVLLRTAKPERETLIRHAFYYLKYAFHRHQHHKFTDDSITTTHPIPSTQSKIGQLLIKDLKEAVGNIRRSHHPTNVESIQNARGICAYALSLSVTCRKLGFLDEKTYSDESAYIEHMSSSLQATADSQRLRLERHLAAGNYVRSLLLLVLSVIAPLTIIHRAQIADRVSKPDSLYVQIAGRLLEGSAGLWALASVGVVGLIIWAVRFKYGSFLLMLDLFRLLITTIVYDRAKGWAISIALTLIALACFAVLMFRAVS